MTALTLGSTPARSRQEVVELIALVSTFNGELGRLSEETDKTVRELQSAAERKAHALREAVTEATSKVQAWFRVHPEEAAQVEGAEAFLSDPVETQLAAVVLASARPLTERQKLILEGLKKGQVLRRIHKQRAYSLIWPGAPKIAQRSVNTNHVFDLQHRFLDPYDPATGERLWAVSAFDDRAVEFRLKPGVVVPC